MIDLVPAIDIIDGSCVRLVEGDFNRKTDYGKDPVEMAVKFAEAGFTRLHVVDLDGARAGTPKHLDLLSEICSQSGLNVDFGGGVRVVWALGFPCLLTTDPSWAIEWSSLYRSIPCSLKLATSILRFDFRSLSLNRLGINPSPP